MKKKLEMVTSINFKQKAGEPLPLIALCFYSDVDIECQGLETRFSIEKGGEN